MRKLRNIACIIFIVGLVFLFLHYPGGALFIISGTLLYFAYSILFFIKNVKKDLKKSFVILSIFLWTFYLVARILYWWGGPTVFGMPTIFIIPLLSTIISLVLIFRSKQKIKLVETLLIVYFIFSFGLAYVNADRVFYFFNLNEMMYKESRQERFQSWDRYSWFLYIVDKEKEALEANQKAQEIIEKKLTIDNNDFLKSRLEILKENRIMIQNKNWYLEQKKR